MNAFVTRMLFSAGLVLAFAGPSLAQTAGCRLFFFWTCHVAAPTTTAPVTVPEIDASAGVLAIAALVCVTLFVWERNRRRVRVHA